MLKFLKKLFGPKYKLSTITILNDILLQKNVEDWVLGLIPAGNQFMIDRQSKYLNWKRSCHWLTIKNKEFNKEYIFQYPTVFTTDSGVLKKEKKLKTTFFNIYGTDGRLLYRDKLSNIEFVKASEVYRK